MSRQAYRWLMNWERNLAMFWVDTPSDAEKMLAAHRELDRLAHAVYGEDQYGVPFSAPVPAE